MFVCQRNRPSDDQLNDEHAGFIMALGLLGHLRDLSPMTVFDYLSTVSSHSVLLSLLHLCLHVSNPPTLISFGPLPPYPLGLFAGTRDDMYGVVTWDGSRVPKHDGPGCG